MIQGEKTKTGSNNSGDQYKNKLEIKTLKTDKNVLDYQPPQIMPRAIIYRRKMLFYYQVALNRS